MLRRATPLEKSETLNSLHDDFTETGLHRWRFTQWIIFLNIFSKTNLMHYISKSSIFSKNQIFRRPLYKSTSGGLLSMFYFSLVFLWCNYSMIAVVRYLRFSKCCLFILFHVFNAFIVICWSNCTIRVNSKYKLCYYSRITSELF